MSKVLGSPGTWVRLSGKPYGTFSISTILYFILDFHMKANAINSLNNLQLVPFNPMSISTLLPVGCNRERKNR